MSEGRTDLQDKRRPRRRWTLGGLMILIAIVAWPLALFARRPRPVEYPERAAWQALSERRVNKPQADAARARDAAATKGGTSAPKDERTMR